MPKTSVFVLFRLIEIQTVFLCINKIASRVYFSFQIRNVCFGVLALSDAALCTTSYPDKDRHHCGRNSQNGKFLQRNRYIQPKNKYNKSLMSGTFRTYSDHVCFASDRISGQSGKPNSTDQRKTTQHFIVLKGHIIFTHRTCPLFLHSKPSYYYLKQNYLHDKFYKYHQRLLPPKTGVQNC